MTSRTTGSGTGRWQTTIHLFAGFVVVKWNYGGYGTRSTGRFMKRARISKKASTRKPLIATTPPLQDYEDVPFGPPPEEFHYRCPHCGCEFWVNEAIIDFELGFAEFEGREPVMPLLGCPTCNLETMEYTGITKSPPEGR